MRFTILLSLMLLTLCFMQLCSGCAADTSGYEGDPTENAIADFTAVYGAPSADCQHAAENMSVDYMTLEDVRLNCHQDNVVGCVTRWAAEDAHAFITEGSAAGVLAHETMHVLLLCSNKLDDNQNHSGAVWHSHGIDNF